MWFKNARVYCLTKDLELSPEEIETRLAPQEFQPCSSHDKSKIGWVSPLGREGQMLTHVVAGYVMVCAQKQERLLPASVVKDATDEKVAELEERQGRKIYRKERAQIKDDVYATLLPRAFTRNQLIYAYLSPKDNLLIVNTASTPKAEDLLNLLRESLGSLPVALPNVKIAPSDVMTRWLKKKKATDHFVIDEDCELYNPIDGSNIVRCKGQDLSSEEIAAHLEAGKQVKNLGVTWNSLLSCVIADDLSVKRLRFEGMVEEQANEEVESPEQKFDQEFAVMSLELTGFFESYFSAFGGLDEETTREK